MKRVLLGMSGGVDSSAAVIRLQEMGYEVVGISFRFTEHFEDKDAKKVAELLSIEHHTVDYRKEFQEKIINRFIDDYQKGLTPNPCVLCNRTCKFFYLLENLEKYHCDYVATGHYAKIENNRLYRSNDKQKDQSYFLSCLPKEMLSKILFPLEGLTKDEVRELARKRGLTNFNKKDSYDVCFITSSFKEYMNKVLKQHPGDIINIKTNEVIGQHKGLMFYTIGQRRGLSIGGFEEKMYVVGKDMEKNILYISLGEDSEDLISTSCLVENFNLLTEEKPKTCTAKFRYRQQDIPVEVEYLENNQIIVNYKEGLKSVTPGQTCVLYQGEECLGGGIIKEVQKNHQKLWYL